MGMPPHPHPALFSLTNTTSPSRCQAFPPAHSYARAVTLTVLTFALSRTVTTLALALGLLLALLGFSSNFQQREGQCRRTKSESQ